MWWPVGVICLHHYCVLTYQMTLRSASGVTHSLSTPTSSGVIGWVEVPSMAGLWPFGSVIRAADPRVSGGRVGIIADRAAERGDARAEGCRQGALLVGADAGVEHVPRGIDVVVLGLHRLQKEQNDIGGRGADGVVHVNGGRGGSHGDQFLLFGVGPGCRRGLRCGVGLLTLAGVEPLLSSVYRRHSIRADRPGVIGQAGSSGGRSLGPVAWTRTFQFSQMTSRTNNRGQPARILCGFPAQLD